MYKLIHLPTSTCEQAKQFSQLTLGRAQKRILQPQHTAWSWPFADWKQQKDCLDTNIVASIMTEGTNRNDPELADTLAFLNTTQNKADPALVSQLLKSCTLIYNLRKKCFDSPDIQHRKRLTKLSERVNRVSCFNALFNTCTALQFNIKLLKYLDKKKTKLVVLQQHDIWRVSA